MEGRSQCLKKVGERHDSATESVHEYNENMTLHMVCNSSHVVVAINSLASASVTTSKLRPIPSQVALWLDKKR
jgi:hypothetical protein